MSRGSEALTTVIASIAVGMIAKDPELTEALRKAAAEEEVPFEAGDINQTLLEMTSMDLLEAGQRLVSDRHEHREDTYHGLRAGAVIPVPHVEGAARESAAVLSLASYVTEFVHSVPGRLDAFNSWMKATHPDSIQDGQDLPHDQIVHADKVLTIMSKVAEQVAQTRGETLRTPGDQGS
jgi:hypothetical protein